MNNKKEKKKVIVGIVNILTTFNNTIITMCNLLGDVICWSSCGKVGFKGSKKNTPFAAKTAAENVILKSFSFGLKEVKVIIKGHGNGRESVIKALYNSGLNIISIEDKTSIAHNGCRPPKKRRL
jgi:small subunit ribosomal protein S11